MKMYEMCAACWCHVIPCGMGHFVVRNKIINSFLYLMDKRKLATTNLLKCHHYNKVVPVPTGTRVCLGLSAELSSNISASPSYLSFLNTLGFSDVCCVVGFSECHQKHPKPPNSL